MNVAVAVAVTMDGSVVVAIAVDWISGDGDGGRMEGRAPGEDESPPNFANSKEKFSTTSPIATKQAATIPRHESPQKKKNPKI